MEYAILVETILGDLRIQEDMRAVVCHIHGAELAVVRDAGGKIVAHFALDGPFQGPLDRKETYRKSPWLMEERVVLPPGATRWKTVVSDLQADRASLVTRLNSRLVVRNEMRFSGYRRFDTDTRIQYTPDK